MRLPWFVCLKTFCVESLSRQPMSLLDGMLSIELDLQK
ncbi:hypothetical protein X747_11315 [Mesorhizobium sp. LNJC384A00]|nr:hypothetical protein X766_07750 [Mesorhizobium sp. LSJC255A00]ESX44994.1 hypothetical protein X764_05540 [Mesorhizobium sp. LSHC440A00]ESY02819.1 hypothetical protein X755_03800 [Mesorhizobium sp. LNJC405B00]ESY42542.1 hypothetical protein X747_11315 [Mesorhizobium sp. LNJC384A00]